MQQRAFLIGLIGALALLTFAACPRAGAQVDLPDVDVTFVLQVYDLGSWYGLQNDLLGTAKDIPKPVVLTVNAGTGESRSLIVTRPRFATEMILNNRSRSLKLGVTGKVSGQEALRALAYFQDAAMELQTGNVENRLTLTYGLSSVGAQLMEAYFAR